MKHLPIRLCQVLHTHLCAKALMEQHSEHISKCYPTPFVAVLPAPVPASDEDLLDWQ